ASRFRILVGGETRTETFTFGAAVSSVFTLEVAPLRVDTVQIGALTLTAAEVHLDGKTLTVSPLVRPAMGAPVVVTYTKRPAEIHHAGLDAVNVRLGAGRDQVTVVTTDVGATTVSTGAGDDRGA